MKRRFALPIIFGLALFLNSAIAARTVSFAETQITEPYRVSDAEAAVSEKIKFNEKRAKLLGRILDLSAKKHEGAEVSYALVQGENILLLRDDFSGSYVGLGKSSRAILSLAIGAMESRGILNSVAPAENYTPLFRVSEKTLQGKISLKDLYSMRAGIPSADDDFFATSRGASEVFDAIYASRLSGYGIFQESALSASAAAYIAAMRFLPEENDLDAAYFEVLKKFVLTPLKIKGALRVKQKFPPDSGLALTMDGIANWLSCETSFGRGRNGTQLISREILEARFDVFEKEKRTPSFVKIRIEGIDFFASADETNGSAHIILISKQMRTGFAVFAANADKTLCMELATEYARMLSDALKFEDAL